MRCPYCKNSIRSGDQTTNCVFPKSRYTVSPPSKNLVTTCFSCNEEKGNRTIGEWVEDLKRKPGMSFKISAIEEFYESFKKENEKLKIYARKGLLKGAAMYPEDF